MIVRNHGFFLFVFLFFFFFFFVSSESRGPGGRKRREGGLDCDCGTGQWRTCFSERIEIRPPVCRKPSPPPKFPNTRRNSRNLVLLSLDPSIWEMISKGPSLPQLKALSCQMWPHRFDAFPFPRPSFCIRTYINTFKFNELKLSFVLCNGKTWGEVKTQSTKWKIFFSLLNIILWYHTTSWCVFFQNQKWKLN